MFRPSPGNTFCRKCEKHVHDLSAMTQRQVVRFLAANAGQRICVAYRTAKDGTILLRPEPRAIGVLLVALGLAACAGHSPEIERPGDECRDESGYVIDCRLASRGDLIVLADAAAEAPATPAGEPSAGDPRELEASDVLPDDVVPEQSSADAVEEASTGGAVNHDAMFEGVAGEIMVDEHYVGRIDVRPPRNREARREARRERRAARRR